jgi:hypothetical protein
MDLGAFATLQKVALSFVVTHLSAHMEQLSSHWSDFHEIWFLSIFENSCLIKIWQD